MLFNSTCSEAPHLMLTHNAFCKWAVNGKRLLLHPLATQRKAVAASGHRMAV